MRKVVIIFLLLTFLIFTENVRCEAKTDDFVWRYYQPDWQWGEREWETPWEIVRELAADNIGMLPINEPNYSVDSKKVKKLPEPKQKGYIFMGWSFGNDYETGYRTWFHIYNDDGAIKDDKTLTANWKKISVEKQRQKSIRISLYHREVYDYREVACLYSANKNMKNAKIVCLNEKFSEKKKKGVIRGRGTKNYTSNYYPKKNRLIINLKKLKKGKTYYLQFRRIHKLQDSSYNLPTIYYCMDQKVLKTVKVKL